MGVRLLEVLTRSVVVQFQRGQPLTVREDVEPAPAGVAAPDLTCNSCGRRGSTFRSHEKQPPSTAWRQFFPSVSVRSPCMLCSRSPPLTVATPSRLILDRPTDGVVVDEAINVEIAEAYVILSGPHAVPESAGPVLVGDGVLVPLPARRRSRQNAA